MLPVRAGVDMGTMAMMGHSAFPKPPSITGTSPSDCLASYTRTLVGRESYSSAEEQSVYSTVPPDWANICVCVYIHIDIYVYVYIYVYVQDVKYNQFLSGI